MNYISRFNEHILSNSEGEEEHLIYKLSEFNPEDLIVNEIYKMSKIIKSGNSTFRIILYLKYKKYEELDNSYIFYVTRSLKDSKDKTGIKRGDIISLTPDEVLNYISRSK
jgi:hypothetical protein